MVFVVYVCVYTVLCCAVVQGAWLLINVALFTYQYWNFQATDKFYYMRLRARVRVQGKTQKS